MAKLQPVFDYILFFKGSDIAFIFPDLKTAFLGEFLKGNLAPYLSNFTPEL